MNREFNYHLIHKEPIYKGRLNSKQKLILNLVRMFLVVMVLINVIQSI